MPAKIAANCFFGALDEMVTTWVLNEHDYRLANVADTVVDIFLNGMQLVPRAGHASHSTAIAVMQYKLGRISISLELGFRVGRARHAVATEIALAEVIR